MLRRIAVIILLVSAVPATDLASLSGAEAEIPPQPLLLADKGDAEYNPDTFTAPRLAAMLRADQGQLTAAASRRVTGVLAAPQTVDVVDHFTTYASLSLPDRLRYQVGVDVVQHRHGHYDVGLRGSVRTLASQIVTQVDGRQFQTQQLGSQWWVGYINMSDIERVDIVRGPASVSYGANAFGGAISITTRTVKDQPEFHAYAGIGSNGAQELDGTVLLPFSGGDYYPDSYLKISAGMSYREDLDGPEGASGPYIPSPRTTSTGKEDLDATRFAIHYGLELPLKHRLEAEYHYQDYDQWESIDDYASGVKGIAYTEHTAGLRLIAPWGELRYLRTTYDSQYQNQRTNGDALLPWRYVQIGFEDYSDYLRGMVSMDIDDFTFSVGAEYTSWVSKSNLYNRSIPYGNADDYATRKLNNIGIFGEASWEITPQLISTAGIRVDDHTRVGTNTSPRFAINYLPNEREMFRFALLSGYRLPNTIESEISEGFFISADDLEAETIATIEFAWERQFSEQAGKVGANVFFNHMEGEMWFIPMDAGTMSANYQTWLNDRLTEIGGGNPPDLSVFPGPFFEYDNNELARNTFGVEFFIDHAFQTAHHKIRPWANVSYLYSRLEDDFIYSSDGFDTNAPDFLGGNETWFEFNENLGDDVNSPSEWKINLGLEWIHPDSGLFMQPAMRFVDKRRVFSFAYSNLRVEPTSVLVQEVPAYVAFDFSIGMLFGDVEAPTGSITFGVMNLFDDQHHESIEADEDLLTQEFDPTYTSVIGRSYSLRGELRF